jgi:hypothetical protein
MVDDMAERLTTDKLTETFSMRIPEVLAVALAKLSPHWKGELNRRLLVAIAKTVHDSKFDPSTYLSTTNGHE